MYTTTGGDNQPTKSKIQKAKYDAINTGSIRCPIGSGKKAK
jgi:hypothetical protein